MPSRPRHDHGQVLAGPPEEIPTTVGPDVLPTETARGASVRFDTPVEQWDHLVSDSSARLLRKGIPAPVAERILNIVRGMATLTIPEGRESLKRRQNFFRFAVRSVVEEPSSETEWALFTPENFATSGYLACSNALQGIIARTQNLVMGRESLDQAGVVGGWNQLTLDALDTLPRVVGKASPAKVGSSPVSLETLADDVLENPAAWFAAPNPRLGGRRPDELIGTDDEHKVYAILNAVDQGLF